MGDDCLKASFPPGSLEQISIWVPRVLGCTRSTSVGAAAGGSNVLSEFGREKEEGRFFHTSPSQNFPLLPGILNYLRLKKTHFRKSEEVNGRLRHNFNSDGHRSAGDLLVDCRSSCSRR
jgi:hypothetical protein